tara:strand:+ start:1839 stop:2894 length:1056 start_codon:yes stop_codon:yes gene_type:complete
MIIQKLLISKETVLRKLPKNFEKKDMRLFKEELKRHLSESYLYKIKDVKIYDNGNLDKLNHNILKNHLGFKSISSLKFIKKIILSLIFFLVLIKNKFKFYFFPIKINLIKDSIIVHDRNSNGYFHWINDILPKLLIIEKNKKLSKYYVLLPEYLKIPFIVESIKYFKIKFKFIQKNETIISKNCYYIGDISESGNPRPKLLRQLREKFRNLTKIKKKNNLKIYISRRFSRRNLVNEKDLENYLKTKKFKILYMEKISFKKQLFYAMNAKVLVGPYGAGLINSFWQSRNSNIIEIKPNNDHFANCFFSAANALNLNYYYIISKKNNLLSSTKTSNYYLNLKSFKNQFSSLLK